MSRASWNPESRRSLWCGWSSGHRVGCSTAPRWPACSPEEIQSLHLALPTLLVEFPRALFLDEGHGAGAVLGLDGELGAGGRGRLLQDLDVSLRGRHFLQHPE